MFGTKLANRRREAASLLNHDGAHGFIVRTIREFAKAVEKRAHPARKILISEFVADRLNRIEEALVDFRSVLVTDGSAGATLERRVHGAKNALQLHTRADESAATDVLRPTRRKPRNLPVVPGG